jgi:hypothetical protein
MPSWLKEQSQVARRWNGSATGAKPRYPRLSQKGLSVISHALHWCRRVTSSCNHSACPVSMLTCMSASCNSFSSMSLCKAYSAWRVTQCRKFPARFALARLGFTRNRAQLACYFGSCAPGDLGVSRLTVISHAASQSHDTPADRSGLSRSRSCLTFHQALSALARSASRYGL